MFNIYRYKNNHLSVLLSSEPPAEVTHFLDSWAEAQWSSLEEIYNYLLVHNLKGTKPIRVVPSLEVLTWLKDNRE